MRGVALAAALLVALVAPRTALAGVDVRGLDQPAVPPITPADVKPYLASGTASLRGRVYAQLPGTQLLYYRNTHVYLEPAIPFAGWLVDYEIRVASGASIPLPIPAASSQLFNSAIRGEQTDDHGRFTFTKLPALPYLVVVFASESEPRTGYNTSTDFVTAWNPGSYGGYVPMIAPVTTTNSYGYTCTSTGGLYGSVVAVAGAEKTVPLALMAARNDGC